MFIKNIKGDKMKNVLSKTNISLCENCYCMTYEILSSINETVYCGKCQAFKKEVNKMSEESEEFDTQVRNEQRKRKELEDKEDE